MYFLNRPDATEIDTFLQSAREMGFSYNELGASREADAPEGYTVDHNRIKLGTGRECFGAAANAIRSWKMVDLGWVKLHPPTTPIEENRNVAVLIDHLGLCSLTAARIVYTFADTAGFGFAYGTLTDHGASGEARFLAELDPESEDVWYDLYAFSRPGNFLTYLGYLYARS